jgi:hypothetical protein
MSPCTLGGGYQGGGGGGGYRGGGGGGGRVQGAGWDRGTMTIRLPLASLVKCEKTYLFAFYLTKKRLSITFFRQMFCYFVLNEFSKIVSSHNQKLCVDITISL